MLPKVTEFAVSRGVAIPVDGGRSAENDDRKDQVPHRCELGDDVSRKRRGDIVTWVDN